MRCLSDDDSGSWRTLISCRRIVALILGAINPTLTSLQSLQLQSKCLVMIAVAEANASIVLSALQSRVVALS